MNSNSDFPPPADSGDAKPAFRKPSANAPNRRYRRRSPISGSSPPDGSPAHERGSSPKVSREDDAKVSVYRPRRDDAGGSKKDSDRSYRGRSSDSYRQSDRQSCGNLDDNYRHDNYIKCDKHAGEEERDHHKLSSRSGRESRGTSHSDHIRSTDYSRKLDKYSRDNYEGSRYRSKDKDRDSSFPEHQKYKDKDSSSERIVQDGKREYHRNSGDYRSGRTLYYEESKGKRSDSFSRNDGGKHQMEEGYESDVKDTDNEKLSREQRKKYDDKGTNRSKKKLREPSELSTDNDLIRSQTQESSAKRTKLFSLEKDSHRRKDGNADGRESSSSKEVQEGKVTMGAQTNDVEAANDINSAKIAAIKAAELVNRNLVTVAPGGCMTADQKKKLLWGNKKNTTAEEVGHRWDTTLFSDRERQEKFNKLMGVKGEIKVEHKPVKEDGGDLLQSEKQKELQLDLEKQYAAGLRRRDGRTVGLGL